MDFKISSVRIECVTGIVMVPFSEGITFFWGNTGVGKTTLLNLINYTLGQSLIRTQTVENEVIRISVDAIICGRRLLIERKIGSNLITVKDEGTLFNFIAKEDYRNRNTFSDYLYELVGIKPIEMLRGRSSKSIKITFSNYMWFSYLRQDELDSTFFYLGDKNGNYKQYASNYVLRTMFDESRILVKEKEQEINRIVEKQKEIKDKLFVLREISAASKLMDTNIGDEIARKNHMLGEIKGKLECLLREDDRNEEDLYEIINCAKSIGKYEAELLYLKEFGKLQKIRKQYEMMWNEYENERLKCEEQINSVNDNAIDANLCSLQDLFKESLLSVGFPNFSEKDNIVIDKVDFFPAIFSEIGEFRFNYLTLSSSGIRTIFKICYALSIHRLVMKLGMQNLLPAFMIIDTPMKNISERVDRNLYTRLYSYFYELFSEGGNLYGMQLIIVDKELPEIFKSNGVMSKLYTKESPLIPVSE